MSLLFALARRAGRAGIGAEGVTPNTVRLQTTIPADRPTAREICCGEITVGVYHRRS